MITDPVIIKELRSLKKRGLLTAEDVVNAAKPKDSPLHKSFCWDNGRAAHLYRLFQARSLISVVVHVLPINGKTMGVRVFRSLSTDRRSKNGGYRETAAILSNKSRRRQLLEDALLELEAFQSKYAELTELNEVFDASEEVRSRILELAA